MIENSKTFKRCLLIFMAFVFDISMKGADLLMPRYYLKRFYIEQGIFNYSSQSLYCVQNQTRERNTLAIKAQQNYADFYSRYYICHYAPILFSGFIMGCVSDRFGRRTALWISWIGVCTILCCTFLLFRYHLPLYLPLVVQCFVGLTGGPEIILATFNSLAADLTRKKGLLLQMIGMDVALGIGAILAFQISSRWNRNDTVFQAPYLFFSGWFFSLGFLAILLGSRAYATKDSEFNYTEMNDDRKSNSKINQIDHEITYHKRETAKNPIKLIFLPYLNLFCCNRNRGTNLALILVIIFVQTLGTSQAGSLQVSYLSEQPFCWSSVRYGVFQSIKSGASIASMLICMLLIHRRIDHPHFYMLLGMLINAAAMLLYGLASLFDKLIADVLIYSTLINVLAGICTASQRSILGSMVLKHEQGITFAMHAILGIAATLIEKAATPYIYHETLAWFPGIMYLYQAGLLAIAFILAIVFSMRTASESSKVLMSEDYS